MVIGSMTATGQMNMVARLAWFAEHHPALGRTAAGIAHRY